MKIIFLIFHYLNNLWIILYFWTVRLSDKYLSLTVYESRRTISCNLIFNKLKKYFFCTAPERQKLHFSLLKSEAFLCLFSWWVSLQNVPGTRKSGHRNSHRYLSWYAQNGGGWKEAQKKSSGMGKHLRKTLQITFL